MNSIKRVLHTLSLVILFASCETSSSMSGLELASESGGGGEEECAFTQGYWKNHPEAWPVSSLKLGGVEYSQAQLLAIFRQPVAGNGLISLAHQLIAAKLNVANGSDGSDISDEIAAADALIAGRVVPPVGSGHLSPSSTSALVGKLDTFNNTGECKSDCTVCPTKCGDGIVQAGEQCDDGNSVDTDLCRNDCTVCPPICGNGIVQTGEECDDGNTIDNDACSNTCKEVCVCP